MGRLYEQKVEGVYTSKGICL